MKTINLLIFLLLFSSCGKDGEEAAAAACVASKKAMSVWTHTTSNVIFDMRACDLDKLCQVKDGATCDDGTNPLTDFVMLMEADGDIALANCGNTAVLDRGKWTIGCDNILKITNWQSGDPDDKFE